jgi:hypothetical protein
MHLVVRLYCKIYRIMLRILLRASNRDKIVIIYLGENPAKDKLLLVNKYINVNVRFNNILKMSLQLKI